MDVIVIETESYYKLMAETLRRVKQENQEVEQWMSEAEVMKLFSYTDLDAWKKYRADHRIPVSTIGNKRMYNRAKINELLNSNEQ